MTGFFNMDAKKLEHTLNEILSNYDAGEVTGVLVKTEGDAVRITIETISRNDVITLEEKSLSE